MSLSAIQDNLVKTNLVQQTQSRGDDISRSQEIASAAAQREHDRQEDQVVIASRETEGHGINPDDEKDQGGKKQENEEQSGDESGTDEAADPEEEGTRVRMRRINIVV